MRRKSFSEMDCPVAQALDVVGDPWTLLIVRDAMWGYSRFGDFHERLGIPRNTLTDRLQRMVDTGIFTRVPYQENPERFDYRLTDKGRSLTPVVLTLARWGEDNADIDTARVTITDRDSGESVAPELVDARSGRSISDLRLRVTSPISPPAGRS